MLTARRDSDPGAGAGDDHLLASGVSLSLEGGTTWWRPGLPASGADQGLRLTECACWRSRARTGVAAMLMGWGEKSNHRKSALDGPRVDVSLAVSPWQARAEVPPTPAGPPGWNFCQTT